MTDLAALGELLIDFTPIPGSNPPAFTQNPGGAPANVLTAAARLGAGTCFVGKVGKDQFGHYLERVLLENGVSVQGLILDKHYHTTLAFVHLDETGNRSFSFYRTLGADTRLTKEELPREILQNCRIFHFGSLTLTEEPARAATLEAVRLAKQSGAVISCDPNWRPPLWQGEEQFLREMKAALPMADLVKVSEEELFLLTGQYELEPGAQMLLGLGPRVLVVTMGAKGCAVCVKGKLRRLPAYDTRVIDTTGSGDAFWGAFLSRILRNGRALKDTGFDALCAYADFANAAGSLCAAKYGAIPALPVETEILACQSTVPKLS